MSRILVVDDEPRILLMLKSMLEANGHAVDSARDGEAALDKVSSGGIDIVITDLHMEPMDGMTLFRTLRAKHPGLPVIILTAQPSIDSAVAAIREGALDYIAKPFRVDEMLSALRRAEKGVERVAAEEPPRDTRLSDVIAASPEMRAVCDTICKIAPSSATVLINGESGTGKEVIANAIHRCSARSRRPMVAVNCAALPEQLLESEMFGHVKGSFTGAFADKDGLFSVADGGTLFLDEVSSMPLPLQGKLLRALQEGEIRRVGDVRDIHVDVRVIAASNSDLERAVVEGRFRNDLYYRLAVIVLDVPPLRTRPADIMPLVRHFIARERGGNAAALPVVSEAAVARLAAYSWPGNVRELENAVKHALAFWQSGEITPELLPPRILETVRQPASAPSAAFVVGRCNLSLKSYIRRKEREYIEGVLAENGGDKAKAAEMLKVNLSTLYRKLSE